MTESSRSPFEVLLLTEDFYPKESGGAFIDWNVAKQLDKAGDSVTVITPRNADTASTETVKGVEIRRPFQGYSSDIHPNSKQGVLRRLRYLMFIVPYLLKLCWERDFELIYSTNHLLHMPASMAATAFRLSHVSFVGYSPSIRKDTLTRSPLVLFEQINFRLFMGDRILCRTPSVYELLSEVCDQEVVRLDGIIDKEAIKSAVNSKTSVASINSESETKLIYVGRLVEIKNPIKLPLIISRLPQEYSLRIVGDGPQLEDVKQAIEKSEIDDRIKLEGRLSHKETLQLIHDSDLLLLLSEAESYGAVVFEALALNTPVLATPVGVFQTVDHQRLNLTELEKFSDDIPKIEIDSTKGTDEEIIERFAVERFAENVRYQMEITT